MRLDRFDNSDFDRGRPRWIEVCWNVIQGLLFSSWLPGSGWRVFLLRRFGGEIGQGVVIKPRVRVKFPWRLSIGDHSWLGEAVWIDNLDRVTIGSHCCISQGVYLCTGNHRWDLETFDLETRPISISDQVWVGAKSVIAPGTELLEGVVIAAGSVVTGKIEPWLVWSVGPKTQMKKRSESGPEASTAINKP